MTEISSLQRMLLLLMQDVNATDADLKTYLGEKDEVDVLVDLDILKDFKCKLMSNTMELEQGVGLLEESFSLFKRKLHNLMCLYSDFIDRSLRLLRFHSKAGYEEVSLKVNMREVNVAFFKVLEEVKMAGKVVKYSRPLV